jgi:hypothetical protein
MPPYVAVRYIIKAKPYTRAAIIGGIDLPYNDLLVRNLRTRNVGGTNEDLLFNVNVSGDSGRGTERMRLGNMLTLKPTQSGTVLAGTGQYGGIHLEQSGGNDNFVGMTTTATSSGTQGGILIQGSSSYGTKIHFLTTDSYSQGMKQRMVLDNTGRLGIGKTNPQVTLDVSGNAAVSGTLNVGATANVDSLTITKKATSAATVSADSATTLVTKGYVDGFGLGVGQSWVSFPKGTGSNTRNVDTVYTNNTGKPIQVFLHTNVSSGITVRVGGVVIFSMGSGANLQFTQSFIVPNNTTYQANLPSNQLYGWSELR